MAEFRWMFVCSKVSSLKTDLVSFNNYRTKLVKI